MRDDFSQQTLDVLAKRVGVRCSNPRCRKLTTGPRSDASRIVNIGVGAHIAAASPGGPRFDASMTAAQRASADNGIWLCQNCAKLVDNDPNQYSVTLLLDWKARAEGAARAEVEGSSHNLTLSENLVEMDVGRKNVNIRSERHDYELHVTLRNLGIEPLSEYHVDLEMPSIVIEDPARLAEYVADRSNLRKAFFRAVANSITDPLFPGDARTVLRIPYHMDHKLFWGWQDGRLPYRLDEEPVRVTMYRRGFSPIVTEGIFKNFENF